MVQHWWWPLKVRTNAYVSHKGHLTKCALEHVRKASTMEQLSAEGWSGALRDCLGEVATLKEEAARAAEPGNPMELAAGVEPPPVAESLQPVVPAVAPPQASPQVTFARASTSVPSLQLGRICRALKSLSDLLPELRQTTRQLA